jgi:hypothetical protein
MQTSDTLYTVRYYYCCADGTRCLATQLHTLL